MEPFSAKLTAVGHSPCSGRITATGWSKTSPVEGVDVCSSLTPDGNRLYTTLANATALETETVELVIEGGRSVGRVRTRYLVPTSISASS